MKIILVLTIDLHTCDFASCHKMQKFNVNKYSPSKLCNLKTFQVKWLIIIIQYQLGVLLNLCSTHLKEMFVCGCQSFSTWYLYEVLFFLPQLLSVHEWDPNWNKHSPKIFFTAIWAAFLAHADSVQGISFSCSLKASWVFWEILMAIISEGMFQRQA